MKRIVASTLAVLIVTGVAIANTTPDISDRVKAILKASKQASQPAPSPAGLQTSTTPSKPARASQRPGPATQQKVAKHRPRFSYPKTTLNGKLLSWHDKPVIIHKRAYVPIRELAQKLKQRTGLDLEVDWENGRIVDIVTRDQGGALAHALLDLWQGQIENARKVLEPLANAGDAEAGLLLGNLAGLANTEAGTVRIDWTTIPTDAHVTIDGVPIAYGEIMLPLATGHHVAAVWPDDVKVTKPKLEIPFELRTGRNYTITIIP